MALRRRPLNRFALPQVVEAGSGSVVHVCDSTSPQLGGPFLDEVTVIVVNSDALPARVQVRLGVGAPFALEVGPGERVAVLADQPVRESGAEVRLTDLSTNPTPMQAFGWFTRST